MDQKLQINYCVQVRETNHSILQSINLKEVQKDQMSSKFSKQYMAEKQRESSLSPNIQVTKLDSGSNLIKPDTSMSMAIGNGLLHENDQDFSSKISGTFPQSRNEVFSASAMQPAYYTQVSEASDINSGKDKSTKRLDFINRNKLALSPSRAKNREEQKVTRSLSPRKAAGRNTSSDDNDDQAKEVAKTSKKKNFNPEIYKFKKHDYNVQQEMFKKSFYDNDTANKTKIKQQLVETTYLQIMHRLDKEKKDKDFPVEFRQNEMKWAAQMMRSKKLQKIMVAYTEQIAQVLESEIRGNIELITDWMKYPHSHSQSPQRNTKVLEQLMYPVWYPERPPVSQKVTTVFNRQRQHLQQLSVVNKKKKEEEIERKVKLNEDIRVKAKITEQVLTRMAATKKKKQPKEPVKPVMTPFQEAIHEGLQIAKSKLEEASVLEESFQEELEAVEKDLTKSSLRKQGKNPGIALKSLLTKWADEPMYSMEENARFSKELWMSLKEFEDFLKEQNFSMELENKNMKMAFRTRVDGIRAQASFRIEALESALIETKLKLQREQERSDMRLAEMESSIFNHSMNTTTDEIERMSNVDAVIKDPTFQDLDDAKKVKLLEKSIKRLSMSIRSCMNDKIQFINQIKELQYTVDSNREFNEKMQANARQDKEMVLYYQQTLYEMLESTGILGAVGEDSPLTEQKQLALKEIIELNQERLEKDEEEEKRSSSRMRNEKKVIERLEKFVTDFHNVIITVDFRSLFSFYQQVVKKKEETIGMITDQFAQLGIIEESTLNLRKTQSQSPPVGGQQALEIPQTNLSLQDMSSEKGPAKQTPQKEGPASPSKRNAARASVSKQSSQSPTKRTSKTKLGEHASVQDVDSSPTKDTNKRPTSFSSGTYNHNFKVSDQKLGVIRTSFDFLALPMASGVTKMMANKEKEDFRKKQEQAAMQTDVASLEKIDELDKQNIGAFGLNSTAVENRRRNALAGKKGDNSAFMEKMKKNQARRVVEQEKKEKKAQELAEKKAKQQADQQNKAPSTKVSKNNLSRSNLRNSKTNLKGKGSRSVSKKALETTKDEAIIQLQKTASQDSSNSVSQSSAKPSLKQSSTKINKDSRKQINSKDNSITHSNKQINQSTSSRKQIIKNDPSTFTQKQHAQEEEGGKSPRLQLQEGFDSDPIMTEPIDRIKDALEEIESKLQLKYYNELEEVKEADLSTFKLKAAQNKQLSQVFQGSLGERLLESDDTAFMMIGNLDDFLEKITATQEKYLLPAKNQISVTPTDMDMMSDAVRQDSIDMSRVIPLTDCIQIDLSSQGELKGFKIRHEMVKMLMWREEGIDISQIYQVIRSVNLLNRILFKPDNNYTLITGKPDEKIEVEQNGNDEPSRQSTPLDISRLSSRAGNQQVTGDALDLFELLRTHSACIISKGNASKQRYQMRVSQNLTLNELLQYKIPRVQETQDGEDKSEDQEQELSSRAGEHLTFLEYIEILLQNLDQKVTETLPPKLLDPLSIQDLVFFGSGAQVQAKPKKAVQTQTTLSGPQPSSPIRTKVESKYSIAALNARQDKKLQTDESLLVEYLRKNPEIGSMIATQHIDKAVKDEMSKTIQTLNDFVSKVQTSAQITEMSIQKKKEQKNMFSSQSKSIATQISSNSPMSQGQYTTANYTVAPQYGGSDAAQTLTPVDQLKAIRSRIDTDNDLMQETITMHNHRQNHMENLKALRTAEMKSRKNPIKAEINPLMNHLNAGNSKFPQLNQAQSIQIQRNNLNTVAGSGRKKPLLHNETQRVASFMQQPFKQVHIDKKIFNNTVNKDLSHMDRALNKPRPSSGLNPPGLVAKKLNKMQHSVENVQCEATPQQLNSSLDCSNFRKQRFEAVISPTASFISGGINVFGGKNGQRNKKAIVFTSHDVDSSDASRLFSPSDRSIQKISKNMMNQKLIASIDVNRSRISGTKEQNRDTHFETQQNSALQMLQLTKPNTSRDFRENLQELDLPKTGINQYITIEPLSSSTRKTSTQMTVQQQKI